MMFLDIGNRGGQVREGKDRLRGFKGRKNLGITESQGNIE